MSTPDSQQFLRDLDKKFWSAADRLHANSLRANLDAADYKHAVLGFNLQVDYVVLGPAQLPGNGSLQRRNTADLTKNLLRPIRSFG